MSEVRLWSVARTANQIRENMAQIQNSGFMPLSELLGASCKKV